MIKKEYSWEEKSTSKKVFSHWGCGITEGAGERHEDEVCSCTNIIPVVCNNLPPLHSWLLSLDMEPSYGENQIPQSSSRSLQVLSLDQFIYSVHFYCASIV